jgi:hypothetical protein
MAMIAALDAAYAVCPNPPYWPAGEPTRISRPPSADE